MPEGTITKSISKFLISGAVKAFRNAIAHGKWHYSKNFTSLIYWDWDDPKLKNDILYEVSQIDLDFWQKLARCLAYVFYQTAVDFA